MPVERMVASVKLEDGYDADDNMRYVSLSLGNMDEDYWVQNKETATTSLLAIVSALQPVLNKTIDRTVMVTTETIEQN